MAAGLSDWRSYSSARGTLLELIRNNVQFPPGTILFEDPPLHGAHRALVTRLLTPRRIAQIEPRVRAYCARSLDPLVGSSRIDFIADLASQMPMRVIGMLLGIPEEDQEELRVAIDAGLSLEEGESASATVLQGEEGPLDQAARFSKYVDWRRKHPSDDLMTELLNARFVDDRGDERTLRDDELLGYIGLLAGAGNETTTRLIGWTVYLLDRFPTSGDCSPKTAFSFRTPSRRSFATRRHRLCRPATSWRTSSCTGRGCPRGRRCCCSTVRRTGTSASSRTPIVST